jgi:hypothetical protein
VSWERFSEQVIKYLGALGTSVEHLDKVGRTHIHTLAVSLIPLLRTCKIASATSSGCVMQRARVWPANNPLEKSRWRTLARRVSCQPFPVLFTWLTTCVHFGCCVILHLMSRHVHRSVSPLSDNATKGYVVVWSDGSQGPILAEHPSRLSRASVLTACLALREL